MKIKILIFMLIIAGVELYSEKISSSVFGAGKETSGGTYKVNGSAYQTHTGEANGTGYNMKAGFWYKYRLSSFVPQLTTSNIIIIGNSKAKSGGNSIDDGGYTITQKGVVWNTTGSPTLSDNSTSDGSGSSDFTSLMDNLQVNETYYVRAYATNLYATGYGNEQTFVYTAIPTLPEWGLIVLGSLVVIFAVRKIIV